MSFDPNAPIQQVDTQPADGGMLTNSSQQSDAFEPAPQAEDQRPSLDDILATQPPMQTQAPTSWPGSSPTFEQAPQQQQPQPWAPQIQPPSQPQVDRALLIPEAVDARRSEITARYSSAWQHAASEDHRQAIQMAHSAEMAQFDARIERAKMDVERYERDVKDAQQQATTEPLYRQIAAQKLSEKYGVPTERLLRTPWGEEITDPRRMLDAALYLSSQGVRANVQQQAQQQVAPVQTGGAPTSDFSERIRRASPAEFQKLVDQAMSTGIRLS